HLHLHYGLPNVIIAESSVTGTVELSLSSILRVQYPSGCCDLRTATAIAVNLSTYVSRCGESFGKTSSTFANPARTQPSPLAQKSFLPFADLCFGYTYFASR